MDENYIEIFQRDGSDRNVESIHPRSGTRTRSNRNPGLPEYDNFANVLKYPFPLGSSSRGKVHVNTGMLGEVIFENQFYPDKIRLMAKKRFLGFELYNISSGTNEHIGTLKSNLIGSYYKFYVNNKCLIEINYRTSWIKRKKPRSFFVIFHNEDKNPLIMYNKEPYYNLEANSYSLNFNGRVTTPSVKNFQLVHPTDLTYIALTFGKTSKNTYIMDHSYPLSTIQGFVISLAALDRKMWCD